MHILNLDPTYVYPYEHDNLASNLFVFSGGEVHFKLLEKDSISKTMFGYYPKHILVTHRLNSSQNIMELLLAADALRNAYEGVVLDVHIPYLPYARQDRVMVGGEPFSLRVFAGLLATAGFRRVYTLDPHSDVAGALIPNLKSEDPLYLLAAKAAILEDMDSEFFLVAPDGGALKKIYKNAKLIGHEGLIACGGKVRDVNTGKILRTTLDTMGEDIEDRTAWIQDDICDGGATFIELAKVLRARGAKRVLLSVSHGIMSKGEDELSKHIDKIYTTNSVSDKESMFITRFKV